jgi:RNA polymerase sigma-70 factor (ECF subfamily)
MDSVANLEMQNRETLCEMTDDHLVICCQKGQEEAFAELITRHQLPAMKLALSILHDALDAEDEVQNAFWKAYKNIGQFQRDSKFSTWLTRIVVNQCLMRLRQARRAKFYYLDDIQAGDGVAAMELEDKRQSPEQTLGQTEVAKVLHREIQRIPPLLRHVFLLRDVQEQPMPEVASQLGISVAAAKSRLLRARAELRNRLEHHQGAMGPAMLMA